MKIKFLIISLGFGIFLSLPLWVQEANADSVARYNPGTKQMEQLNDADWETIGVPADHQRSIGACSVQGQQTFNTTTKRMEFCDGTKKFNLICGISVIGCGVSGQQRYDTDLGVMLYCNGANWVYMGSVPSIPCCPEGFVPVPRNLAAGTTKDFCVSKYHMKPVDKTSGAPHKDTDDPSDNPNLGILGDYIPESRAADMPWGNLTLAEAKEACNKLNKPGIPGEFHLITNAEWMTVAYSIENETLNWSGNAVGVGHIPTGHSDGYCSGSPAPAGCEAGQTFLAADPTDSNPCFGTHNPNCIDKLHNDFWQKRIFILNNTLTTNTQIWDMAGNMNSWVDAGGVLTSSGIGLYTEIYQLNDTKYNKPPIDDYYDGPIEEYPRITPFLFPPDPRSATNSHAFLPANSYGTDWYDQLGFGLIRIGAYLNMGIFRGGKFDEPRVFHSGPDPDDHGRRFKTGEHERRGGLYSAWIFNYEDHYDNLGFRCSYIPDN